MTRRISLLSAAAVFLPALALNNGCAFLDSLTASSGIVDVFTTSHGTPDEQGNMPNRNGEQLIFTNDMGWQVFINEAYVTTSAVTLVGCDGERYEIEMYWGALAEDLGETADREPAGVGGVRVLSGTYCNVVVEYGPASTADAAAAMGTTVLLTGSAVMGDQHIDFTWRSEIEVDVDVDISRAELGSPFEISTEQHVSKKLTLSKTYNHFFDGVDFGEALSQEDIDDLIADNLRKNTIAVEGTRVGPHAP